MKEIEKALLDVVRMGYSPWSVFDDWVALMTYALMRNDEEYLKIVGRYRNDREKGHREIDHFCRAFAELQLYMQKTNEETLGQLYENWEIANKHNGQFFTPVNVCDMMAQMLGTGGAKTLNDPCCGSGRMLVSYLKTMKNNEADEAYFVGQDIDMTCVYMTALNFVFFNMNGQIIHGNTLAFQQLRIFQTTRSYMGGSIRELEDSEFPKLILPEVKEIEPMKDFKPFQKPVQTLQASLF